MKKYTLHTLSIYRYILTFFLVFCLSGCLREYNVHYESEYGRPDPDLLHHSSESATIENLSLLILPDPSVKQNILSQLEGAKKRIWIEIYTWTEKDTLRALIDAHRRSVDVRVILEPNVYGTPIINKNAYTLLESNGVPVAYADGQRYTFTHAKFFLIDDSFIISTGNLTQSFFTNNRELMIQGQSDEALSFLSSLFLRDFSHLWTNNLFLPAYMVVSPIDSREKLLSLIWEWKKSIIIYNQTLSDRAIIELLSKKADEQVKVEICTAKNETNTEISLENQLNWKKINKPYPHLKLILIDESTFFIGSQNLTTNSLDNNREIGIIIRWNFSFFSTLMRIYREDCSR